MADQSSIGHVQEAEAKAKKLVEDAEKSKIEKVEKARQKAREIIEEAEGRTKGMKEDAIKKASGELAKERERKLSDARSTAKKLESKELSRNSVQSVVNKLVRHIFG